MFIAWRVPIGSPSTRFTLIKIWRQIAPLPSLFAWLCPLSLRVAWKSLQRVTPLAMHYQNLFLNIARQVAWKIALCNRAFKEDNLNILGQICTLVKFSNSKITYPSDFLVSDNIQYECVLGWDFINRNKLSLSKSPGKGYFLVGRHGKTSIRDNLVYNLVGVTHTCEQHSSTERMLCQSTFQSNAANTA
jgi:hypothetical protein